MPPYYAWRVVVILRKGGQRALGKRFLAAWLRHFSIGPGARYQALAERPHEFGIAADTD